MFVLPQALFVHQHEGLNQETNTALAVDEQVYGDNLFGAGDDVQEEISGSGTVSGNTMEASTFAIGDHVYEEDLSGVTEVCAYLLPGNAFEEEISGTMGQHLCYR
jgi:hypothetical protein